MTRAHETLHQRYMKDQKYLKNSECEYVHSCTMITIFSKLDLIFDPKPKVVYIFHTSRLSLQLCITSSRNTCNVCPASHYCFTIHSSMLPRTEFLSLCDSHYCAMTVLEENNVLWHQVPFSLLLILLSFTPWNRCATDPPLDTPASWSPDPLWLISQALLPFPFTHIFS
jgi:hypothetical protein